MTFLYFFAIALFMILCALLCFVILIQESKSTGLGASFGGDTTDSLFGTSTADVLKKFTAWGGGSFLDLVLDLVDVDCIDGPYEDFKRTLSAHRRKYE